MRRLSQPKKSQQLLVLASSFSCAFSWRVASPAPCSLPWPGRNQTRSFSIRPPSCRRWAARARWLLSLAFVQIAFTHDQVHGSTLATNLIFEIAMPFGKQRGHDAPGWEFTSQGLVADPLSDLVLVKRH